MNIKLLINLSRSDHRCFVERILETPFRSWEGLCRDDFLSGVYRLLDGIAGDACDLVKVRLLAEHLVYQNDETGPVAELICKIPDITQWVPGGVKNRLYSGTWRLVPVVLVSEKRSVIRYFVTGCIPGVSPGSPVWPGWAGPLMDGSCKSAIRSAAKTARRHPACPDDVSFFCFPLAIPNNKLQFEGFSLGLPISLGFLSSAAGSAIPGKIIATGRVDDTDNNVLPVGHFQKKACAVSNRGGVLIHPAENTFSKSNQIQSFLPVETFSQAWMFTQLYRTENVHLLSLFSAMLEDPRVFISNLRSVPGDWLTWAKAHRAADPVMSAIEKTPVLFSMFTDQLASLVRAGDTRVSPAISGLVDDGFFDKAARAAPLSAFKWCVANLSLNNHRGKTGPAEQWVEKGKRLIARAGKADLESVADFFNNMLVAAHNRYRFSPELPPDLENLLELLEKQYRLQFEYGCPTHMVLGRLYGSLTQNFGFCGPGYLDLTEKYGAGARKALGENSVPEFENDWRRQLNYLTYARLDAGNTDAAKEAILAYLQIDRLEPVWEKLPSFSKWEHALVCRFIADTENKALAEKYARVTETEKAIGVTDGHPWQLWHYNMGRLSLILDEPGPAQMHFRKSLDFCLSNTFGPTVTVMALLPLAGLSDADCLSKTDLRIIDEKVVPAANHLNPDYFREVTGCGDPSRILEWVRENRQKLFPFSYR